MARLCKCGVEVESGARCKLHQAEYMRELRARKKEAREGRAQDSAQVHTPITPSDEVEDEAAGESGQILTAIRGMEAHLSRIETRLMEVERLVRTDLQNNTMLAEYFDEVVQENRAKVAARQAAREVQNPNGGPPLIVGNCYECGEPDAPRRPSRNGMEPRCYCNDCHQLIMSGENQAPKP